MNKGAESPRVFASNRRAGSVEYALDEFAFNSKQLMLLMGKLQISLTTMLDLGGQLLSIDSPIIKTLLAVSKEDSPHKQAIVFARLALVCEFAIPSQLEFPEKDMATFAFKADYLMKSVIKDTELLIEYLVNSNLPQVMLVLNDYILPTHEGEFNEHKNFFTHTTENELSTMLNVILSFDEEIARAKLEEVEITSDNILLSQRIRALSNLTKVVDGSELNSYLAFLAEHNKNARIYPVRFKFTNVEAHAGWAIESLMLWLIAIEQDCVRMLQAFQNLTGVMFEQIIPHLLERFQVDINCVDLVVMHNRYMKWWEQSRYTGLRDALFPAEAIGRVNHIEHFMSASKLLQAELQMAIERTAIIMSAHPENIQGLTSLLDYCNNFLETCVQLRIYSVEIAKTIAPQQEGATGYLASYTKINDAFKLNTSPGQESSKVQSSRPESRIQSTHVSPRGPTTSGTNSPRTNLLVSAGAASSPLFSRGTIRTRSTGGSPRETVAPLLLQSANRDDGAICDSPRLTGSPQRPRRGDKAPPPDSLRKSKMKDIVRKSGGGELTQESSAKIERNNRSWSHRSERSSSDGRRPVMSIFAGVGEPPKMTRASGSVTPIDLSSVVKQNVVTHGASTASDPQVDREHAIDNSTQDSTTSSSSEPGSGKKYPKV